MTKTNGSKNRMLYTQQRNYEVPILKKIKFSYYANLNEKKILDKMLEGRETFILR